MFVGRSIDRSRKEGRSFVRWFVGSCHETTYGEGNTAFRSSAAFRFQSNKYFLVGVSTKGLHSPPRWVNVPVRTLFFFSPRGPSSPASIVTQDSIMESCCDRFASWFTPSLSLSLSLSLSRTDYGFACLHVDTHVSRRLSGFLTRRSEQSWDYFKREYRATSPSFGSVDTSFLSRLKTSLYRSLSRGNFSRDRRSERRVHSQVNFNFPPWRSYPLFEASENSR